jgi:LAO/AO transport system kinase
MNKMSRPRTDTHNITELAKNVIAGERRAVAKAITLVESTRPDQQADAEALLSLLLPHTGRAIRIGMSGAPGVGKSSFIEAFGLFLTERKLKVAVLAVDPSSTRSGGSILGDKTRMEELSRDPMAFIRPSPAGETLGGVARRTREARLILEAAGYDVVLIETVGVGQSETAVAEMVDMFALILSPGAGDELQGIKRGIMELADLVIMNKADGDMEAAARHSAADYLNALHFMRPKYKNWRPQVRLASAIKATGLEDIWQCMEEFCTDLKATGEFEERRRDQARSWMWTEIKEGLISSLETEGDLKGLLSELEASVAEGRLSSRAAAQQVLAKYRG